MTIDEKLIDLTSTFSAGAFGALLATFDARETLALFDPAFGQPWKQRQAIYRRIARIHGMELTFPMPLDRSRTLWRMTAFDRVRNAEPPIARFGTWYRSCRKMKRLAARSDISITPGPRARKREYPSCAASTRRLPVQS